MASTMNRTDLTPSEWTVYEAGSAYAHALRWRVDAEMAERDGKDSTQARKYQAEYETEHERLMGLVAKHRK
jgi:hypothetical protein